jgi:uncharacterized protein
MSELLFDVGQMLEARVRVDRTYAASAVPSDDEVYRLVAPVVLSAGVTRHRDQYRLAGTVSTTVELACVRCLESFQLPVHESFDVLYLPRVGQPGEVDKEIGDDDPSTAFYSEHVIDLGQLLQEQFYLAVPMKPLCREDCRGLCSICGINLNTGSCSCTDTWIDPDPRLAKLRNLLKKD